MSGKRSKNMATAYSPMYSQSTGAECSVRRATIDNIVSDQSTTEKDVTICDQPSVNDDRIALGELTHVQHGETI